MGRNGGGGKGGGGTATATASGGADLTKGATVDIESQRGADAMARELFGRTLTPAEWATVAGAPDGASVTVQGVMGGGITVTWFAKGGGFAVRKFGKGGVYNDTFTLPQHRQGQGIGRSVLKRQVNMLHKLGIKEIRTKAAGDTGLVGYKVWPRLGYDGAIPSNIKARLPGGLKGATKVSHLMKTKAGREWWDSNGGSFNATFNTTPGSYSRRVLDRK